MISMCNAFQSAEAGVLAVDQGAIPALVRVAASSDGAMIEEHALAAHALYNCSAHKETRGFLLGGDVGTRGTGAGAGAGAGAATPSGGVLQALLTVRGLSVVVCARVPYTV